MATVAVSGTPQAATATSTGAVERVLTVSGTPQAITATSSGVVELGTKRASGAPQAETATSSGVAEVGTKRAFGTPQAATATSSGVVNVSAVFGKYDKTCVIKPETFGCIVKAETFGCIVPVCNIPTTAASANVEIFITVSGSPQADTATSTGSASLAGSVTVSGAPQAETASSSGTVITYEDAGTGAWIWLNPSTIVKTGSNVTSWDNDPTATKGTATVTTAGGPIAEDTYNAFEIVRSTSGSPGYMVTPAGTFVSGTTGYTIYLVGGFDDNTPDPPQLLDSNPTTARILFAQNTAGVMNIAGDFIGAITSMSEDTLAHVWAIRIDPSNHRARISGSGVGWQTNGSAATEDYSYGLLLRQNIPLLVDAIGWVGEVIIENFPDSDATMDTRFNQLLAKWGISG